MRKERLDRLAGGQHGLFARRQALALGLTAKQVDHGARVGWWPRVHRGVYRMPGAPRTELQSLLAAVLAAGDGAVASHRAAAWLWGLCDDLHLDVTGPAQRSPAPGITVHRRPHADLRPVVRRGIPCTDPLRTALDLAALGDAPVVDEAVDRGVAARLFTAAGLEAELGRQACRGRRGVAVLRDCLDRRLDDERRPASMLESAMDRILVRYRLARPERQHEALGGRYRLDYAWPEQGVAVEVDGYGSHSSFEVFGSDRERQNALVLAGWTVLRFTWADVRRRPAWVAGQIRRALAASRPA